MDPYPNAKAEVERELADAVRLQAAVFSGRPDAIGQLKAELSSIDQAVGALETAVDAMVTAPGKFGLQPGTAYHRQVEVESLRYQLQDLKRASDQVAASSSRPQYREIELRNGGTKLPVSRGGGGGGTPLSRGGGVEEDDTSDLQSGMQQLQREQDHALDEISIHVGHIKTTGQLMHEELQEQERLLSDLADSTDTTQLKLRGLRKRVNELLRSNDPQLWTIVGLSILLVILTVLALM